MNIAFLRLGNEVELDLYNGSPTNSGAEIRLGIFKHLVSQGHKIKIYSKIKEADKPVLTGKSAFAGSNPLGINFDYSWCKEGIVDCFGQPISADVVFLENGSDNTMFGFGKTYKESYFYHTCQLLHDYEGKCIYYQHGELPFPFGEQYNDVTAGVSDANQRKIMHQFDVQKGKDWLVLTHASELDKFRKFYDNNRCQYAKLNIPLRHEPLCYDQNCYAQLSVKETPSMSLLYVGKERDTNRQKKLVKFYDQPDIKTVVIGEWKTREGRMDYRGKQGAFWEVQNFLHDTYCSVQIADKIFEDVGMPTTRIFQVVSSGACLLADGQIRGIKQYANPDFLVFERRDVADWVQKLHSMRYLERIEQREKQQDMFKTWDKIDWGAVLN